MIKNALNCWIFIFYFLNFNIYSVSKRKVSSIRKFYDSNDKGNQNKDKYYV